MDFDIGFIHYVRLCWVSSWICFMGHERLMQYLFGWHSFKCFLRITCRVDLDLFSVEFIFSNITFRFGLRLLS